MPYLLPILLSVCGLMPTLAHAQTAACSLDLTDAVGLLFNVPPEAVLGQAFQLGFTTPISAYLCAYLVGILVSMFDK